MMTLGITLAGYTRDQTERGGTKAPFEHRQNKIKTSSDW
jgi:hypothetical protein